MHTSSQSDGLQFLLYTAEGGDIRIDVLLEGETVWLSQKQMAELFDKDVRTINEHIGNIFDEGELERNSTIRKFRIVQKEGEREVEREIDAYNLDVIISVGYRVKSLRGTQFRKWATQVLREYIIKGFAMNDERFKNPNTLFGKDYFQELLEGVRAIRASERRVYQKITDIFAECSIDYDPQSEITRTFYATVQNKFHYAITGQTAAEIITEKADASKPHMGLTTWKNAPKGKIYKYDVVVAKNYLPEEQIKKLERLITSYLDYIERLIEMRTTFTMQQLSESIHKFLEFNEYKILQDTGKVSQKQMENKVEKEYETFRRIQDQKLESDFDREVKKITGKRSDTSV